MKNKGNLIVISGPSGTGKGTVCKELLKAQPEIVFSISATTRKPRPGEVNGKDYWFLSKEEFQQMIAENRLLRIGLKFMEIIMELQQIKYVKYWKVVKMYYLKSILKVL